MDNRAQKGIILKQSLEARGISLMMVHEATKIPLDALKAIEEGYTVRTLSPFYYRGFLKMYAQYLGVDIKEIVEDYQPEQLPKHLNEKKGKQPAVEKLKPILTEDMRDRIIKALVALIIFIFFIKVVGFLVHKISHRPKGAVTQNIRRSATKTKIQSQSATKDGNRVMAESKPLSKTPAAVETTAILSPKKENEQGARHKIDLTVRAKKDSWLQVKVDGEIVFRSTLKKGVAEAWHADKNIELSGRDIGDLEFELNGRLMGPLGKENRKAKSVVIDPNGFSVK